MRRVTMLAPATGLLVIVAAMLTFALSYIGSEEQPPCLACKQSETELHRASVCEITQRLDGFADKLVRIDGRFRNDAGQLSIEDRGCTMHIGFDRERRACGGAWRKLQVTCGVDTWYDGSASARLVGHVAAIPNGNYYAGEKGFVISCLETVQTNPTFSQRIRFVLGRLSPRSQAPQNRSNQREISIAFQQPTIEFSGMRRLPRIFPTLMSAELLGLCFTLSGVMLAAGSPKQSGRPRITGIDHVTIFVSDVQKSRRFYSDVLGLAVGCPQYSGSETCLRVPSSEQQILLKLAPTKIRMDSHNSWLAEITFATDEVSDLRQYLLTHGLKPGPIQKDSDGAQSFRVRDPEGNSIGFVHRLPPKIENTPSSKQTSLRMIHAGFVVKDLAAENRFYVELLGFRLYWRGGFKDDGTDWYELQVPDGPDWIEYMLNIPANADHKELGVQNHFSFGVKDVHAAAAELRSRGYKTFDGPEVGRDGKDSLDAYDPDDTRVEIMELTPVQKPCCHPYTAEHPRP